MTFLNVLILQLISLVGLVVCGQYQLSFGWKLSLLSTGSIGVGYVTWNEATILTMKQLVQPQQIHLQNVSIDFTEGINQLGFYFIGVAGQLTIDNIAITKPPKTINFIVNGDFQFQNLGNSNISTYKAKIPGWSGQTILIGKDNSFAQSGSNNQVMILSPQTKLVSQAITFGKTNKYSFTSSYNDCLQKQASDLIAQNLLNLQKGGPVIGSNSWISSNISTIPSNSTSTSNINALISSSVDNTANYHTNTLNNSNTNQIMQQILLQIQQLTNNAAGPVPFVTPSVTLP